MPPRKKSQKEERSWKDKLVPIGVIISLVLGLYTLIERGFFSSFFVSPVEFRQEIERLENGIEAHREHLIRLEVKLENIENGMGRVESKIDRGTVRFSNAPDARMSRTSKGRE